MKPDGQLVPTPRRVPHIKPGELRPGTLRIVVFGPGKGEAIVVQLPDESVGVVDGCAEPRNAEDPYGRGDPVREYLNQLAQRHPGGAEKFRLAFVCLTHPHADHYAGLGRLLAAYAGRIDAVWNTDTSQPRYHKDLAAWIRLEAARRQKEAMPEDGGGLTRFLDHWSKAHEVHGAEPKELTASVRLLATSWAGEEVSIYACSPSSKDVLAARKRLHRILFEEREGTPRNIEFDPNQASGSLLIRWGQASVLLAGDLLRGEQEHSGWQAASKEVLSRVQVVNVAHHGSEGAHHEELWRRMDPALAIVTPFLQAKNRQPPQPDDITRLARTSVVAITTPPAWHAASPPLPGPRGGMELHPSHRARDIDNAIAVSLDVSGRILDFVLAGAADIYKPPAT